MPIINQVVSGSGGGSSVSEPYLEYSVDANGQLISTTSRIMDFTGIKQLNIPMSKAYMNNTNITGVVDMSSIEGFGTQQYGWTNMFQGCTGITSVDLSSVKSMTTQSCCAGMFSDSGISSIDIRSLESLTGTYAFSGAFSYCPNLLTVQFQSLKTATGQRCLESLCSGAASGIQSLWFYALTPTSFGSYTNQFTQMLRNVTQSVTVHFPMAIQSTIGSWTSVTSGFDGADTTVLFDIVTSLTGADSNTYTRSEKNSTSTATAWSYNNTLYYTSGVSNHTAGVNEPTVGDTIYSDSACTTAVTTISAIA